MKHFTQCAGYREFFSGTTMFDRHRVGEHEHGWSLEFPEGRRCMSAGEMRGAGWRLDAARGWQDPARVLAGREIHSRKLREAA